MGIHYGKADFINYGKPSLLLDFARNKSLVDRISGNNLITFARASTGTYVGADGLIKYAGADEARFDHDPTTGESLGLLIEESRTNLITYSQNFNVSFWDKLYETTIVPNDTTSPDGSQTATRVYQSGTTNDGYVVRYAGGGLSVTTGQTYTLSFYTKKIESGGLDRVQLSFDVSGQGSYPIGGNIWFNFSDPNSFLSNSGAFYEELPNGWYRIGLTRTATLDGTIEYGLTVDDSNSVGVYVWGIQLERGSFPTSYIPTSGSTVTRSADIAKITGTNFSSWYNPNKSTLYGEGRSITGGTDTQTSVHALVSIDDNTNNNRFMLRRHADFYQNTINQSGFTFRYRRSSINLNLDAFPPEVDSTGNLPLWMDSNIHKMAFAINNDGNISSNIAAYGDGVSVDFANTGDTYTETEILTPYTAATQMQIGFGAASTYWNGHIGKIIYYPTRLTNTQLQELTAQ